MKTLSKDPKNEIAKYFLQLLNKELDIPLYTTRPENEPLPYVRLMFFTGMDSDYKNIEQGYVRLHFYVYSADDSVKEVSEIIGTITQIIKTHAYDCPYVAKVIQENLWIQDVNKPDIRQGETAYRFQYYN